LCWSGLGPEIARRGQKEVVKKTSATNAHECVRAKTLPSGLPAQDGFCQTSMDLAGLEAGRESAGIEAPEVMELTEKPGILTDSEGSDILDDSERWQSG
jgi:hypothetical protein